MSILYSFLAGFLILGIYFVGLVACSLLVQNQTVAFPLILDFTRQWIKSIKARKDFEGIMCIVCSGSKCRRYEVEENRTPWKYIRVMKKLNNTVEHLLNRILREFILSWYGEFTTDVTFVWSLRNTIRYSVCLGVYKIMHLDTGRIISDKLIPCAIRHIDDYLCMERIARLKNIGIEQVAISYLGPRLHTAATNRTRELAYLRQLAACILPGLLPRELLKCCNSAVFVRELFTMWTLLPLMDTLADPNVINLLTVLTVTALRTNAPTAATRQSPHLNFNHKEEDTVTVELLCSFGERYSSPSPFALDLKRILKDTELLYAFMQYLKKEDKVYLLQFCLDLEEFNAALLQPDLSSAQLLALHHSATVLYRRYIALPQPSSHIGCDRQTSHALQRLLAGGPECVVRLRTTEPLLFAAADQVYATLERDWLKPFCRSADFYKYICKGKKKPNTPAATCTIPANRSFGTGQREQVGQSGTVARTISTGLGKIKGVLAVRAPVEGAPYCNAQPIHVVTESTMQQQATITIDMSAWKVAIPNVITAVREKTGEQGEQRHSKKHGKSSKWLFHVEIESMQDIIVDCSRIEDSKIGKRDLLEKRNVQWIVVRKEQDFYTLKAKLSEILGNSTLETWPFSSETSVEDRRSKYTTYLRHSVAQSKHCNSTYRQLLHNFLTCRTLFEEKPQQQNEAPIDRTTTTTVDLESIYQSVTSRLRKEKGQHLDTSFMATFLKSTGTNQQRQQRDKRTQHIDWADLSDAMDIANATPSTGQHTLLTTHATQRAIQPKTLHNQVFNDNFGLHSQRTSTAAASTTANSTTNSVHPKGLTDSLFYLLKHILNVRVMWLRMLAAVCNVAQDALESIAHRYIHYKIRAALNQDTLTYLITELEEVIFSKHTAATSEQLEERKRNAFKQLRSVIPDRLANLLSANGTDVHQGVAKLLDILHNPHLNKHLAYNLLDLILLELYPELDNPQQTKENK